MILGCESDMRLITISIDKYPTFIGLINENCTISTIKQICISTFRLNGFTMLETDLRILYAAEDLSDQTCMILTHSPSKLVLIRYDRVVFIFLILRSIVSERELTKLYSVFRKSFLAPFIRQRSVYATTESEIAAINRQILNSQK